MGDLQNKARAYKFRELVQLFLRAEGVEVERRLERRKLSERLAEDFQESHLTGLDRWAVLTRNEVQQDWSGSLDDAQKAARHDGKERAAAIQFRRDRDAGESYVVMSLRDFAAVLRSDNERAKS